MNIGEYIKIYLAENDRSIRWLALKANISDGYLNRIIKNKNKPSLNKVIALAGAMKVPLGKFLSEAGIELGINQESQVSKNIQPELISLIQVIKENPEKAKAVAPLIKKILNEQMDPPGDLSDFVAFILDLPESQRKGILMAFGKKLKAGI